MKRVLTCLFIFIAGYACAGEIVVHQGESLHEALRQAREWRRTGDARCQGGITIRIMAGRYYMSEPLYIRPEDSGTADSQLIIRGEEGTVICGDSRQRHTQLWPQEGMERMIAFDTGNRTITIPTPPKNVLSPLSPHSSLLEMVVHQRWAIAILRVKAMDVQGNKIVVSFMEPESRLEFEHPWPQPVIGGEKGSSSFLLRTTEQHDGIEQLLIIDGASHVWIQDITFENTCWNRPLHKGHVTLQGGFPLVDAYKLKENPGLPWDNGLENQAWIERPVSAVTVRNSKTISFTGCRFQHLGATALDFESVDGGTVDHNTFEDIGGTAIMGGSFAEAPREVHRPYGDLADRCHHLTISNNTIHDAACEDWGAVAIGLGYVRDCTVSSNTVSCVNYSGICVGWGWTPLYTGMQNNHIINNEISDYARQLYDAGGIYTLSNQPGSTISGNFISAPYPAPYATNDRGFCIYLDARTDGFTLENNRTTSASAPSSRPSVVGGLPADTGLIRREEIGDNHPGPNLLFKQ